MYSMTARKSFVEPHYSVYYEKKDGRAPVEANRKMMGRLMKIVNCLTMQTMMGLINGTSKKNVVP